MGQYFVEFVDEYICLCSDNSKALALFDLLFADLKIENIDLAQVKIKTICNLSVKNITSSNDESKSDYQWHLTTERFFTSEYEHKYQDFLINSDDELCFHLLDAVLYYFADNCKHGHMIHAACVSNNDGSILLPGNSGAGKSTLMTWLLKKGFQYQTDELVFIDKNALLQPFKRSIQIKSYGYEIVEKILDNVDLFDKTREYDFEDKDIVKGRNFAILPWSFINSKKGESHTKLKAIIFPQYSKTMPFSFKKISSAKSAMKILSCHINARNLKGHGVAEISSLCRQIPAYDIVYNDFSQLEEEFIPILDEYLQ